MYVRGVRNETREIGGCALRSGRAVVHSNASTPGTEGMNQKRQGAEPPKSPGKTSLGVWRLAGLDSPLKPQVTAIFTTFSPLATYFQACFSDWPSTWSRPESLLVQRAPRLPCAKIRLSLLLDLAYLLRLRTLSSPPPPLFASGANCASFRKIHVWDQSELQPPEASSNTRHNLHDRESPQVGISDSCFLTSLSFPATV